MPAILVFLCLLPLAAVAADDVPGEERIRGPQTFTFLFENDLFGDTDAQYTNGIKLSWLSPDLKNLETASAVPDWLLRIVRGLNAFEHRIVQDDTRQFNIGVALGQMMFTPEDTQSRALVVDDRPYAGWLYGTLSFVSKTDDVADTLDLQLGVIGPASLAEQAARLVHDIRDLPKHRGWDNQIENEPGVLVYYERKWRVFRTTLVTDVEFDFITHAGGAVGNVAAYLATGGEARIGWRLPHDFGTSLIRPGGDANAPTVVSQGSGIAHALGVYAFAGVGGRAVGRDIFLDGNTFKDSHDVDKKHFVGDLVVGASIVFRGTKLSYAQVFRTREFDGQDRKHNFGSISLSWAF